MAKGEGQSSENALINSVSSPCQSPIPFLSFLAGSLTGWENQFVYIQGRKCSVFTCMYIVK